MGLWIFRPGFSRIAVLGLSIIVIMLLMSFLRFDPPVAPVWQLTLLVLAMLLFTFMSVLVGWNSLFLVSGHWRLAPALAFLPFLAVEAVLFGPAFSWELRDPVMIVVVLGAGACSVGLSAALVLAQGAVVALAGVAFLMNWTWFFRIPGSSRLFSFPLPRRS